MLISISLLRLEELTRLGFTYRSDEVTIVGRVGKERIFPINAESKVTITRDPDFIYAFRSIQIENEPDKWFWDFYGFYSHMNSISSSLGNMFFVEENPITRALMYFATCIELEGRRLLTSRDEKNFICVAAGSSFNGLGPGKIVVASNDLHKRLPEAVNNLMNVYMKDRNAFSGWLTQVGRWIGSRLQLNHIFEHLEVLNRYVLLPSGERVFICLNPVGTNSASRLTKTKYRDLQGYDLPCKRNSFPVHAEMQLIEFFSSKNLLRNQGYSGPNIGISKRPCKKCALTFWALRKADCFSIYSPTEDSHGNDYPRWGCVPCIRSSSSRVLRYFLSEELKDTVYRDHVSDILTIIECGIGEQDIDNNQTNRRRLSVLET